MVRDAREWSGPVTGPGIRIDRQEGRETVRRCLLLVLLFPHFLVIFSLSSLVARLAGLVLSLSSHSGSVRRQQRAASSNSRRSLQLSLF
jgi:hypothetical protein